MEKESILLYLDINVEYKKLCVDIYKHTYPHPRDCILTQNFVESKQAA